MFISGMMHKWKHLDVKIPLVSVVSELYLDSHIRLLVTKLNLQIATSTGRNSLMKSEKSAPDIHEKLALQNFQDVS